MTARARAVETAPSEPTSVSRRRADRMRSVPRPREVTPEQEGATPARLDYSVSNIPATPSPSSGQESGAATSGGAVSEAGVTPDTELPGLAPAPAPGITAEQVAAREAQTAAATASLDSA